MEPGDHPGVLCLMRCDTNISGQTFGVLTAIQKTRPRYWLFTCKCSRTVELKKWNVVSGRVHSCGCQRRKHPPLWTEEKLTLFELTRYQEISQANVVQWDAEVRIKSTQFARERLARAKKLLAQIEEQIKLCKLATELL